MSIIGRYKNGNYMVTILSDGTKIRENDLDFFEPAFAENCDVKITDRCDGGCAFCYEGCTVNGKHGDILSYKFLDTLHPYTELAINGNDLSHPDLFVFLQKMKDKNIIVNMTVNQIHFEKHYTLIKFLVDQGAIYGLGISLNKPTKEFVNMVKEFPNAVVHTINGILSPDDYEILKDNGLKVLILGYKQLRRGVDYYNAHEFEVYKLQKWLYANLEEMLKHFEVVSFDNLAINQLNVKRLLSEDKWDEFFMGDDGIDGQFTSASMYLDLVKGEYAVNSCSQKRYKLTNSIDEMFQNLKEVHKY